MRQLMVKNESSVHSEDRNIGGKGGIRTPKTPPSRQLIGKKGKGETRAQTPNWNGNASMQMAPGLSKKLSIEIEIVGEY